MKVSNNYATTKVSNNYATTFKLSKTRQVLWIEDKNKIANIRIEAGGTLHQKRDFGKYPEQAWEFRYGNLRDYSVYKVTVTDILGYHASRTYKKQSNGIWKLKTLN